MLGPDRSAQQDTLELRDFRSFADYIRNFGRQADTVDSFTINVEGLAEQIEQHVSSLCVLDSDKILVDYMDVEQNLRQENTPTVRRETAEKTPGSSRFCSVRTAIEFAEAFGSGSLKLRSDWSNKRARLLFLSQEHSYRPFWITESQLSRLFYMNEVHFSIIPSLLSFGAPALPGEEGLCHAKLSFTQRRTVVTYLLRFPERSKRPFGNPWAMRQIAVHQEVCTSSKRYLTIFLQARHKTVLQTRLETIMHKEAETERVGSNPMLLHLLVLTTYAFNWRWHVRDLGSRCDGMSDIVEVSGITDEDLHLNFETLQKIRHLESEVLPLLALLEAQLQVVATLKNASGAFCDHEVISLRDNEYNRKELQRIAMELQEYISSVRLLLRRIQGITALLSDALNFRNQSTAAQINQHILSLTRDTVDDSATVRVVTLVTLIYLPATFIATIFGMNFFDFDSTASQGIVISKNFWMYLAVAVPFTIVTVAYWLYKSHLQRGKRNGT